MTTDTVPIKMSEKVDGDSGMLTRNLGLLLILLCGWIAAFWPTFRDMAELWMRSDTFAHGLVVVPIAAYLIWRRRVPLSAVAPQPAWWMLVPLLLAIVAWGAGVAFSVAGVEHLAGTAVLVLTIWFCVGHRFFGVIAFPIMFLMFMAPVGDFLVPTFMDFTADFTVTALRLTGVPVFQEGHHFVLPNGRWSVVSACSGIRYLIASFMVGALYAYLNYRTLSKRVLFVLVALLVPIVANWVRAYMIVMLGYLSGNTLAVGVDHLLYGWVFFGIVIALMFWIGNRWADPDDEFQMPDLAAVVTPSRSRLLSGLVVGGLVLVTAAWGGYSVRPVDSDIQLAMTAPAPAPGWTVLPDASVYRPDFRGYRGESGTVYAHDGAEVSLYVALYADQAPGREMVAWSNKLWPDKFTWRIVEEAPADMPVGRVNYVRLIGPDDKAVNVWHWYRVDDRVEDNDYLATFRIAWRRLREGVDGGAHVVVAVPSEDKAAARKLAEAFMSEYEKTLDRAIDDAVEAKD